MSKVEPAAVICKCVRVLFQPLYTFEKTYGISDLHYRVSVVPGLSRAWKYYINRTETTPALQHVVGV